MIATTTAPGTVERRTDVLKWGLGLDQSDAARAANAALRAGLEAVAEAREAWSAVKAAVDVTRPISEVPATSTAHLLRRLAVKVEQQAGKTLALASTSACGLWAVTLSGRIVEVESTSGGSEYLDGVRLVEAAQLDPRAGEYVPSMARRAEEWPLLDVVAFADSYARAHEIRQDYLRA